LEEITHEMGVPVSAIITVTEAADHLLANDVAGRRYLTADDRERIHRHLIG
jgi:hypothetical protein